MGLFDHFPYTNFHELNLMWILQALKEIQTTMEQFVAINALKYADPIQWNIVQQYEKNTIVIDPLTGTAYISVQPVPTGVALTNTDYWTIVFDLGSFVTRAAKNFTTRWEEATTLTATFPTASGEWLVWGDTLYKALVNITAGDQYVVNSNIEQITMEQIKNEIFTYIDTLVGDLDDLSTTDKSNIVAAINEIATEVLGKIGDLNDLITTDKSNLVAAINEIATEVLGKIGDLDNLTTSDKSDLVSAINEVVGITNNRMPILNVKDYGAAGDGVTDDAGAFNQWLKDVGDNGAIGFIPNGIYYISSTTVTYRNESGVNAPTIIGESKEGVILRANPNQALSLLDFRKVAGAHIENVTLDCNDSGSIDNIHFGMYFVDCDNVTIRNVEVINTSYCGVMAYCSDPASYYNTRFDVHKLSVYGTGRSSVGDNQHPMGCIFENMQHSYFSDIYVTGVCKYAFEFKDYSRQINVDGLDIFDCVEGLYFGGDHNSGIPLAGFYCANINVSNYVARKVDYPIYGGYATSININNVVIYDVTIQEFRFGNSRNIDIAANITPDANTTHVLYIDTCMLIHVKLLGRTTTLAGPWIYCSGSCSSILMEIFGALDTSASPKVTNANSSIRVINYTSLKKYNSVFTDDTY